LAHLYYGNAGGKCSDHVPQICHIWRNGELWRVDRVPIGRS